MRPCPKTTPVPETKRTKDWSSCRGGSHLAVGHDRQITSLGSTFCGNARTVLLWVASRSRTPAKLQYEPRVDILQRGYDVRAAKYGRQARLAPTEITFFPQNVEPSHPPPPPRPEKLFRHGASARRGAARPPNPDTPSPLAPAS